MSNNFELRPVILVYLTLLPPITQNWHYKLPPSLATTILLIKWAQYPSPELLNSNQLIWAFITALIRARQFTLGRKLFSRKIFWSKICCKKCFLHKKFRQVHTIFLIIFWSKFFCMKCISYTNFSSNASYRRIVFWRKKFRPKN